LGGTLCKIGSPLLSFLLCSLCTPLQRKKQIAGSTEVLLTADNLQQYVKKIEVDRGKITYTEFLL
jgi:hypothetical protein